MGKRLMKLLLKYSLVIFFGLEYLFPSTLDAQSIVGLEVVPHSVSSEMRWRRPADDSLGAKVELFVVNSSSEPWEIPHDGTVLFDDSSPAQLLREEAWAWHDTPSVWGAADSRTIVPSGALAVFAWNGKTSLWSVGSSHHLRCGEAKEPLRFDVKTPGRWLSAVTFLCVDAKGQICDGIDPNRLVIHVVNDADTTFQIQDVRLWLPTIPKESRAYSVAREFKPQVRFPADGLIPAGERGGILADLDPLPRGYCVVELRGNSLDGTLESIWGHLRIKPERFDISGGWIASNVLGRSALTLEPYLKTLRRMHINTGQIEEVSGYTDRPELYTRYPMKRFNRMADLDRYDRDEMLPTIHAVEFIGEPQYGGGRPIPPQEVFQLLAPYRSSRLPTSVTLSEERTWRYYAGLSDYPHYDAYRVIAPAADDWRAYDRWSGKRLRWGAPLETIGVMTRSLRQHSRPSPIAYWAQGAHDGWGGSFGFNPRRASPNSQELRSQAWHGLGNRVTSLYWFNLSLRSLLKFPDLIEPITRVNRECRLLEGTFLEGDAFWSGRFPSEDQLGWEVTVIGTHDTALIAVHDLDYRIDSEINEFRFDRKQGEWMIPIPRWLKTPTDFFAIDADKLRPLGSSMQANSLSFSDEIEVVGLYVLTSNSGLRQEFEQRLAEFHQEEQSLGFDPGNEAEDLQLLRSLLDK